MRVLSGRTAGLLLGAILFVAAGCVAPADQNAEVYQPRDPSGFLGAFLPDPYVLPEVTLTDTSGHPYNIATSPSKPVVLVFFGYTNCPDVCIGVLSSVALALDKMSTADQDMIQLVFVTTDPARDTPEAIRDYLDRFDPRFIGLTGDLPTIKSLAQPIGVDIQGEKRLSDGGYEVGHSAQVIGFDKDRRGVVLWTPGTPIADLVHDYELLVDQQR